MMIITDKIKVAIKDDDIKSIYVQHIKEGKKRSFHHVDIIWDGGQSVLEIDDNQYTEEIDCQIVNILNKIGRK